MIIGIPTETKSDEYRIALRPVGAQLLVSDGHEVLVQAGAGRGSGIADEEYVKAGASIVTDAATIFSRAELIVKVKEPLPAELALLKSHHIVFSYFHFASSRTLTEASLNAGYTAIAYETLSDAAGTLPLLTPMSEVAGSLSIQSGAKYLERPMMGRGILLGGVPGVEPGNVLVLGAGIVGTAAAKVASGLGANVVVMDINLNRLRYLDTIMPANVTTIFSDPHAIEEHLFRADLVIGAVLLPGRKAPKLISRDQVRRMKTGSVIVDVCIDQGGCVETSRPTTHQSPTYIVDDVVHYCVTNMPGAVGRTSTHALCNATLPYVRQLARRGVDGFIAQSPGHVASLNVRAGKITNADVAAAFEDLPFQGNA
ncbi:MAG TPA: alanine dehydrogenase [Polyangiaceae bacterium]|jgi:alanine dehydrogenase|nr:alanine dehydrogenase [Polyangiaceae bacterium]